MKSTTNKQALLYKYSRQDPQLFYRFDGVAEVPEAYAEFADEDGQVLCATLSSELMAGSTVRILIKEGSDRESVLAILDKIRDWIAKDEETLSPEKYQEHLPIILSNQPKSRHRPRKKR